MPKFIDLSGKKFGRLTVLSIQEPKAVRSKWFCVCDCGKNIVVEVSSLRNGRTKSCGCYRQDKSKERMTTHGLRKTRTYRIWAAMKTRCLNHNAPAFMSYGNRGISICERWSSSFVNFLEDMGEAPDNCSIDRINNNLGYSKENCRWATVKQQNTNRRSTRFFEYKGELVSLTDISIANNICQSTLWRRIYKQGLSLQDALAKT